tara:strand:+ start:485 stop:1510 length:1026 start_codon:yes stop_codon:yes gene_type:complete
MSDSREWTAARDEYTYQLVQSIMPPILEIFEGIYNKVKETQNEEYALVHFQLELQKIPHWNNISIERECKKIISGYPSLMDHVAAVFVSNIQILSCVRMDTDNKRDIHIKIPTRDSFIHKVLIQCAENIFQDPLLFWHNISYGEKRENTKKKQNIIDESIKEAIREMLPIQDILKEYLSESGKNDKKTKDDQSVASKESDDIDSDSSGNSNFDRRLSKNAFDNSDNDSDDDDDDSDHVKQIPLDNANFGRTANNNTGLPMGANNFHSSAQHNAPPHEQTASQPNSFGDAPPHEPNNTQHNSTPPPPPANNNFGGDDTEQQNNHQPLPEKWEGEDEDSDGEF